MRRAPSCLPPGSAPGRSAQVRAVAHGDDVTQQPRHPGVSRRTTTWLCARLGEPKNTGLDYRSKICRALSVISGVSAAWATEI